MFNLLKPIVKFFLLFILPVIICIGCGGGGSDSDSNPPVSNPPVQTSGVIIDHNCTNLDQIPDQWVNTAKANLRIAYGHSSAGEQLITGMEGLIVFKGSLGSLYDGLNIDDHPFWAYDPPTYDLGDPNREAWAAATRGYLNDHPETNVIIWAWCGQVSDATEADIDLYLSLMNELESDYPDVKFVYMTGPLAGTGLTGNLHLRNEQIREHCRTYNKILYDFADIESFNPDGVDFRNLNPDNGCGYDSNGDGLVDRNWAIDWQNSHVEGVDWYNCPSAHSQPLNANLKAYAAWWLWAKLAGWDGQ